MHLLADYVDVFPLALFLNYNLNGLSNLAWLICHMVGCFDILNENRFFKNNSLEA